MSKPYLDTRENNNYIVALVRFDIDIMSLIIEDIKFRTTRKKHDDGKPQFLYTMWHGALVLPYGDGPMNIDIAKDRIKNFFKTGEYERNGKIEYFDFEREIQ